MKIETGWKLINRQDYAKLVRKEVDRLKRQSLCPWLKSRNGKYVIDGEKGVDTPILQYKLEAQYNGKG